MILISPKLGFNAQRENRDEEVKTEGGWVSGEVLRAVPIL